MFSRSAPPGGRPLVRGVFNPRSKHRLVHSGKLDLLCSSTGQSPSPPSIAERSGWQRDETPHLLRELSWEGPEDPAHRTCSSNISALVMERLMLHQSPEKRSRKSTRLVKAGREPARNTGRDPDSSRPTQLHGLPFLLLLVYKLWAPLHNWESGIPNKTLWLCLHVERSGRRAGGEEAVTREQRNSQGKCQIFVFFWIHLDTTKSTKRATTNEGTVQNCLS